MKLIFPFLICILFSSMLSAQSQKPFFGKTWLKPPKVGLSAQQMGIMAANPSITVVPQDTAFFQLKPLLGVAYSFPNYQAQVVAGLSYQHVKYKYQTENSPAESYVDYAINLLYSAGGSTADKEADTEISSWGLGIGLLNKTLGLNLLFNKYRDPLKPDEKAKLKPVFAVMYSF